MYVALTGEFTDEDGEVYEPGDVFGNLQVVSNKQWHYKSVMAKTEASAVAIPSTELASLIEQANISYNYKELQNFLALAIPRFDQLSGNLKHRLAKLFTEKLYMPGTTLIPEGKVLGCAYLVREGRCKVVARKEEEWLGGRRKVGKQGYVSSVTEEYQIKVIGAVEWIGEEILFEEFGWKPIDYSAIVVVKSTILCITKENLKKFPLDVLSQLRAISSQKMQWRKDRKAELFSSIMKIHKLDPVVPTNTIQTATTSSIQFKTPVKDSFTVYNSVSALCSLKEFNPFQAKRQSACRRLPKAFQDPVLLRKSHGFIVQEGQEASQSFISRQHETVKNCRGKSLPQKRKLEVAATFKTLHKKMLCPTFTFRSQVAKRAFSSQRHGIPLPFGRKKGLPNDEFVVGVKGVRIIDVEALRPPPSPNLARMHLC